MESYYSEKLTGGSYASAGFTYQDRCSLILLFLNMSNPNFVSLSVETLNDITLNYQDHEVLVQVKKQKINKNKFKKLLSEVEPDNEKQYLFVGTAIQEELENLLRKKKSLLNVMKSNRSATEIECAISDYKEELKKHNLDKFFDALMRSDYKCFPEELADTILYAYYSEWIQENKLTINQKEFMNHLKISVQELRSERGFLTKLKVLEDINKFKIESNLDIIVNTIFEKKLNAISDGLKILGEDKTSVLSSLEELIKEANDLLVDGEYREALRIYEVLSRKYKRAPIYERCAALNELLEEHLEVINYCDKLLEIENNHFDGHIMKGTAYGGMGELDSALDSFFSARKIKDSPELFYNIGVVYRQKKEYIKSRQFYKKCLEMDDTFYSAHLNISEFCSTYEAIKHLDRALELKSDLYQAYGRKGEVLRYIGLYDLAIKHFEKCLEYDQYNYQSLLGVSLCLMDEGRLEESTLYFTSYLKECLDVESKLKVGESHLIVDTIWHRTRYVVVTRIDYETYRIKSPENDIIIKLNDDGMIFASIVLESGSVKVVFGKKYSNKSSFINNISSIKKSIVNNSTDDIDGNDVTVLLEEREDRFCLKFIFGSTYSIFGFTDTKSVAVEVYERAFNILGYADIILSNSYDNETFVINNIRNIQFVRRELTPDLSYKVSESIIDQALGIEDKE
ncbi:tetratricopeptide repeat protein [Cohnella fermenti]|uniref:Tetratricopeptide repeat protein n=1 Tax=Cohnella fermenti TaxID=2565925 RepID=A0A4S4BQ38_9BACL|nr:tetratricopeptide repeat protein [Cohnella fermenti]THF76527.1 hypothetical protein E6C55_18485 [Cohnella fermenti]